MKKILFCLTLILIGLMSASAAHAEAYTFVTKWGSPGDGELIYPTDVAVDSSGNVYVAEPGNNRIQKFSSTGAFIAKWGSYGSGDGQFAFPEGVAVDSSGNVYVADSGNISNHRIQKFSSTGAFITKWGSYGSGDGQFAFPTRVAVDSSDNVYVADIHNNRIQKFDSNGNFITKWGSWGSGDGQFYVPFTYFSVLMGITSLIALVLFMFEIYMGLGPGGMERMVAYPMLLWATGFGGYMMSSRQTG